MSGKTINTILGKEINYQNEEYLKQIEKAKNAVTIDFQIDSLTQSGGFYMASDNIVALSDKPSDSYKASVLIHEEKHRQNQLAGSSSLTMSLEQFYKTKMHDEISAKMSQLIAFRDEYIKTGDINVFDTNKYFSFYKEAIENKSINPMSTNIEDFEKDMSLIANGTQEMWMDKYFEKHYKDTHTNMTFNYYHRIGGLAQTNDDNYKKSLDIYYNIGGVDFNKYIKQDITAPDHIKDVSQKAMSGDYMHSDVAQLLALENPSLEYDGSMSIEQYYKYIQHQIFLKKLKENTDFLPAEQVLNYNHEETNTYVDYISKTIYKSSYQISNVKVDQYMDNAYKNKSIFNNNKMDDKEFDKKIKDLFYIDGVDYYGLVKENPTSFRPFEPRNKFAELLPKTLATLSDYNHALWSKVFGKSQISINTDDPDYPSWSEKNRVSEVFNTKILDLQKDIIIKPEGYEQNEPIKDSTTQTEPKIQNTQNVVDRLAQLRGTNTPQKDYVSKRDASQQMLDIISYSNFTR